MTTLFIDMNSTQEFLRRLRESYPKSFNRFKERCNGKKRIVTSDDTIQTICERFLWRKDITGKEALEEEPDEATRKRHPNYTQTDQAPTPNT